MSLRLGRQCCHRSFRNTTTGERKRIFRNDVVSRFGRGEEEPPPPASDRGVWSRENARARRDPHQNTHPCFGALLPDHHFWRLSQNRSLQNAYQNATTRNHRRPKKKSSRCERNLETIAGDSRGSIVSLSKIVIRIPRPFFQSTERGVCRGRSQILFVSRICKRAFFKVVSSRHIFSSPIYWHFKNARFSREYSFEEEQKREMTFDPRTRRIGNVLIASCLFCFASGVYYYAATGGRGFSFGINNASSSSSRLDDDVQRAVDARERKKTRDATEEDTTKRRRRRHARREEEEEEEAKGRHRRFFWQKKKQ